MQSSRERRDSDVSNNNEEVVRSTKESSRISQRGRKETSRDRDKERHRDKTRSIDQGKGSIQNILSPITSSQESLPMLSDKYIKKIFCWGFGKYGQLGSKEFQYSPDPLELANTNNNNKIDKNNSETPSKDDEKDNKEELNIALADIEKIKSGEFHTAILTKDNKIYSFGKNTFGQLGLGHNDIVLFPTLIDYFTKKQRVIIWKIALGGEHTLALSKNNELFSWGLNIFGQLGLNSTTNTNVPTRVEKIRSYRRNEQTNVAEKEVTKNIPDDDPIVEIAAGAQHSLILVASNHIFSCGFSKNSCLGYFTKDEDPLESMIFTKIPVFSFKTKFSKLTCGVNHSGCVFGTNDILIWGKGESLIYDNPTVINFSTNYAISEITDFKIGENFYIIKNTNGELFSCGNNDYGQLGIGNNNNSKRSIQKVCLNEKIKSFNCGYNYVIAIGESNKVYGWGYNKTGQILDIQTEKINLPKELTIFQEMNLLPVQVSCGGYHAVLYSGLPSAETSQKSYEKINKKIENENLKFFLNKAFEPQTFEKELNLIENLNLKHKNIQQQIQEKEKEIQVINKRIEEKKQKINLMPQRGKRKTEKGLADKNMQFDEEIKMEDLNFFKDSDIGTGTFGEVKKCFWRKTLVAVKFLKKAMENEKENIQSFIEELNLLKKLRHPNILLYLGANITGPNFFLVTEFCDLGNLFDFLHNNPRSELAETDRIRIALEIAKGVNYLHSFDPPILHRDLKSLNILLDKNMTVKIADFGWARLRDIHMTKQRGTFQWMAPEVIKKNSYTEKADVFSYGIILWELWVQEPPYKNIDRFEVAKSVATIKNYRPPLTDVIPESIKALISACWDYNPDNRPTFEMIIDFIERLNVE